LLNSFKCCAPVVFVWFWLFLLVIFYLTNKETSKGWVCDKFPRQFHFFLGAIHEKHKFKYLKNLTVKVCKIVETAKKGGCLEDHFGIKNRIKKIPDN
jgi:hypothetical protein